MSAMPSAAERNPNPSGTQRGPSTRVETTTTTPRTRKKRPTKPTKRASAGPSARIADGAVSTGVGAPSGAVRRIGSGAETGVFGSGVVLVLIVVAYSPLLREIRDQR